MPASFTLYGNRASSSSNRVRIMLAEAGFVEYKFVSLDFKTAEQKVGSTLFTC
jgi:glutathione S-transferase